ncbi:MAG: hypothetical protein QOI48_630 [Solirubrobacteraceae bacterium]|jgi:hypothetical protein|nr:hypothetical protein [Solirubrobacteraceae bacterium]
MQRDLAAVTHQEGAEHGDPRAPPVWREALKTPDAIPMRWCGAWLIATAVMAGMAKAVTPTGTLETISGAIPPDAASATSSAPAAPAVRPATMAFHSPM